METRGRPGARHLLLKGTTPLTQMDLPDTRQPQLQVVEVQTSSLVYD